MSFGINNKSTLNRFDIKSVILVFMVAVYPLIVIPGPLDYFRGPRYILLTAFSLPVLYILYKDRVILNYKHIPLGLFIVFALISTVFADDPWMAWMGSNWRFTGLSTYLFCILLFLLASYHLNIKQVLASMFFCAVVVSIIGIMQFYGINFIPHQYYDMDRIRAYSTMGNINWFGTYTVFILPGSLLLYLNEKKWWWLVTTAIIYGGLLVSFTRGAWLSFFVTFIIISTVLYKNREINKHFIKLILVLASVSIILLSTSQFRLLDRIQTVPEAVGSTASVVDDSVEAKGSVYVRLAIWEKTLEIIKENPAFGIGADHLRLIIPENRHEDKAHNIYLEIAMAMGLFALVSYLVFLSFFFRRKNTKTGFLLMMMVFTYLVQGLFNNDVVQVMPLFWITLGLAESNENKQSYLEHTDNTENVIIEDHNTVKASRKKNIVVTCILAGANGLFILAALFWYIYPSTGTIEVNGSGVYTGELRGSSFHGEGTWKAENGVVYEGEFQHGYFDGHGKLTYPNGAYYIGEFNKGYFHGEGRLVTQEGEIIEGFWKEGSLIEKFP